MEDLSVSVAVLPSRPSDAEASKFWQSLGLSLAMPHPNS